LVSASPAAAVALEHAGCGHGVCIHRVEHKGDSTQRSLSPEHRLAEFEHRASSPKVEPTEPELNLGTQLKPSGAAADVAPVLQHLGEMLTAVLQHLGELPTSLFNSETSISFKNVIPTLEFYTQKSLGTVETRFYIGEMF